MTDHTVLIERLEKAEAGSAELDALVIVAVANEPNTYVVEPSPDSIFSHQPGWYRTGADLSFKADPVTTSIDATVALVERALPGSRCLVGTRGMKGDRARAAIIPAHGRMVGAKHRTPAMALCIALLKALQPKEQPNG